MANARIRHYCLPALPQLARIRLPKKKPNPKTPKPQRINTTLLLHYVLKISFAAKQTLSLRKTIREEKHKKSLPEGLGTPEGFNRDFYIPPRLKHEIWVGCIPRSRHSCLYIKQQTQINTSLNALS